MNRPRQFPNWQYDALRKEVGVGEYTLCTDLGQLSSAASDLAAYPGRGNFYGFLLAASYSSEKPLAITGIEIDPARPVLAAHTIRYDEHGGEPHVNVDERLLFPGTDGRVWRLEREKKGSDIHYTVLSDSTGLAAVCDLLGVPSQPRGFLEDLRRQGAAAFTRFSTST